MPSPRETLLNTAFDAFREQGYANVTLEEITRRAKVDPTVAAKEFPDKNSLLFALLKAYSPEDELSAAIESASGESAEEILREAMRAMVRVATKHEAFFELAVLDAQVNNGTFLANMSAKILPKALNLLGQLKETGQLRPVPDPILGRTMIALLMGFMVSERAMPQMARFAMRLFPQRAWLDGMVDLLLYGVLEDDQR